MTKLKIYPSQLNGSVQVPPSKSYTHRAVTLSALAEGVSRINNPLNSRDTLATVKACQALGAIVNYNKNSFVIEGNAELKVPENIINVDNSGTTMRFFTAISSLVPEGFTILTGDESIRTRPMQPLISALSNLGVECYSSRNNGLPPIIVKGGGLKGGETTIRGDISSQYISALLITALKGKNQTKINVTGKLVSKPYVDMTLKLLNLFKGQIIKKNYNEYIIPPEQTFSPSEFDVPGDFGSASLMIASALLAKGRVTIKNLNFSLPQADMYIINILEKLGANFNIDRVNGTITVSETHDFNGAEFDLSDSPDLLPVLSVLALKSKSKIMIRGVEHARFKETDRVSILANELRKFGAQIEELKDGMIIKGCEKLKGCSLDPQDDHRLFMAFCAAALTASEPCIIDDLESIDVSYPNYVEDIKSLGAVVEVI